MASDYHLKLDGIEGESKKTGYENQIDVSSWQFGGGNPVVISGGGMSAGKVTFSEITFTGKVDKSTPKMLNKMAKGEHINSAVLTCLKSTGATTTGAFLTVTLKEVYVTNLSISGSEGTNDEMEAFSLAYGDIELDYKIQDESGTLSSAGEFEYDLKAEEVKK